MKMLLTYYCFDTLIILIVLFFLVRKKHKGVVEEPARIPREIVVTLGGWSAYPPGPCKVDNLVVIQTFHFKKIMLFKYRCIFVAIT